MRDVQARPKPVLSRGYTVAEVAARYRVGEDKVRAWIRRGELAAVNVAGVLCARPQLRITPEALAAFEGRRTAAPPPKPSRRRRRAAEVDYYPD
jgi:excisionase family DNA binding protein